MQVKDDVVLVLQGLSLLNQIIQNVSEEDYLLLVNFEGYVKKAVRGAN